MATLVDYKAVITTEVRVPLSHISEEDVSKLVGKGEKYLKKIEAGSNVRIEWDKKGTAFYIHGEPKAVKHAYAKVMELISKSTSTKESTTPTEAAVNLLGKEFIDGVLFRKFHDTRIQSDDDGNDSQDGVIALNEGGEKNIPKNYVLDPINMTYKQKERGRIMASDLWRTAHFVEWDFKRDVIRDASMVLRTQLKRLSPEQGMYLRFEMDIGKVVFHENNKKYPLEGAKFAVNEFRHLRFTNEITSTFCKEWDASQTSQFKAILPTLGYDKDGNTLKTVKIYHTSQQDDEKCYENIWSADILEGKRLGDKKPGTLEFLEACVRGNSPFTATVYNPATSLDFRFSIVANTHESPENVQQIEERIRRGYRYSPKRGLLVNSGFETCSGYKPLILPKARLIRETRWVRGNIKVFVLEVQDGLDSTFEVNLQSSLLENYTHELSGDAPLTDVFKAMTELFEAAEEINGELNVFGAESSPETSPGTTESSSESTTEKSNKDIPSYDLYRTPEADKATALNTQIPRQMDKFMVMATSAGIAVRKELNNKPLLQTSPSNGDEALDPFNYTTRGLPKKTDFGAQPRSIFTSPGLPDSPTISISETEVFWEGRVVGIIGGFGFGTPVLTPTKKAPHEFTPMVDRIFSKEIKTLAIDNSKYNDNPINKKVERNTISRGPSPISVPPHLRPAIKSLGSTTLPLSPSHNNFSDCFFDLLDSVTDGDYNPSASVLTPRKVVSPRSGMMKIDFFGSVEPSTDSDDGDLMSWGPNKNALTYIHDNSFELEDGEGVSLLLD